MNKSIFIKFIMTLLLVILISGMFYSSSSYAMGEVISGGKDFLSAGSAATTVIKQDQLKSTSNYIYNTLLAVAIVVAVIVAMVLGIQFMAASADEKAKVKEALIPFVVGCVVVFGSFTIWKVAVNIGNKTEGNIRDAKATLDQAPIGSVVERPSVVDGAMVWYYEGDAVEYLSQGKSLSEVPNNILNSWYGPLSRAATGNRPRNVEEYNAVKAECQKRGFFDSDGLTRTEVTERTDVYYYEE